MWCMELIEPREDDRRRADGEVSEGSGSDENSGRGSMADVRAAPSKTR
jgi:hypothetical protein